MHALECVPLPHALKALQKSSTGKRFTISAQFAALFCCTVPDWTSFSFQTAITARLVCSLHIIWAPTAMKPTWTEILS